MARERISLKTPEQILLMREAGLLTAAALAAVKAAIKPGVSTLELDAIAEKTISDMGGNSNFKLVPGYFHTICASINHEVVHGIPSAERTLAAGDLISIDAGAITPTGWNGDAAFSMVVPGGDVELSAKRQKIADTCEASLWAGIAALAGAKKLNEVGRAVEKTIRANGQFGILRDYIGHGVGRSMHEDPAVFNYATKDMGPKVEPGLVIAIEPMITGGRDDVFIEADGWTISSKDGTDAAHFEHTTAVHEGGIWVLTAVDGGAAGLAKYGVTPVPISAS